MSLAPPGETSNTSHSFFVIPSTVIQVGRFSSCLRGSRCTFALGLSTIINGHPSLDLIAIGWAIVKNRHHNEADLVKLPLGHCLAIYQFTLFSPSCAGPYSARNMIRSRTPARRGRRTSGHRTFAAWWLFFEE
jgi:hypothetical protein